jgi:hypothetical protein
MVVTIQSTFGATPSGRGGDSVERSGSGAAKMAGPIAANAGAAAQPRLKGVTRLEPSQIEYKKARFLITDRPDDAHINSYIEVSQCKI